MKHIPRRIIAVVFRMGNSLRYRNTMVCYGTITHQDDAMRPGTIKWSRVLPTVKSFRRNADASK